MVEVLLLILAVAFFARRGRSRAVDEDPWSAMLAGAESAGIITAAQREQLLAYAARHRPPPARLGGVAWLGVFAGLFVVAGVALLIARNWDDIGPVVRVGGFLVALLAAGEGAIRTRERALAVSLPLELLWFFLPLLGIGLYGQTFQLSGDPLAPILVWLALTAPLAWMSRRPVVATVHTAAMAGVLLFGNYLADAAATLLGGGTAASPGILSLLDETRRPVAWVLSLLLLAAIAVQSLRLLPRAHRHHFVGVWAVWIFCLVVAPTPFHLGHEGWIIVAALALATLWNVCLAALDTSFEERAPSTTVWLAIVYALTFTWHMDRAAVGTTTASGVAVVELALLAAIAGTLALPGARLSPMPAWAWGAKAILVAPLLAALLYLGGDVRQVWLAAACMNAVLLVVAVGSMWHGSLVHDAAQVNLGVLVLVGLLITRFLDVFGSMLRSGIGFIVAGILLALLSWALERTRRRLLGEPREVRS